MAPAESRALAQDAFPALAQVRAVFQDAEPALAGFQGEPPDGLAGLAALAPSWFRAEPRGALPASPQVSLPAGPRVARLGAPLPDGSSALPAESPAADEFPCPLLTAW